MNYSDQNMFDYIIVGSGLAGSTLAYLLSNNNLKVLVLEKGQKVKRDDLDWDPSEILIKERYKTQNYDYVTQYNRSKKELYFNEVVGGASIFYGGAAFRLKKKDFHSWPITYDEFEPFYVKAEHLLQVHGDSLNPHDDYRSMDLPFKSPELSDPAKRIQNAATKLGLKPFNLPLAIDFNKCIKCNTCDGFPCKIEAKVDAQISILDKALKSGASLSSETVVTKIIHDGNTVRGVRVYDKKDLTVKEFKSKNVIVSAGSIHSSALLLHSGINEGRIAGHDIGKYLMRHCNAVQGGLFPFKTNPSQVFHKQIAITDFYEDMRDKLHTSVGVIQDIYTPSPLVLRAFLPSFLKWSSFFTGYIQNLLCIAEESPQITNRVSTDKVTGDKDFPRLHIEHSYKKEDYLRRDYLLKRARRILRKAGALAFKTYKIDTFSHAVGTVRFGNNEKDSALNRDCKVHHYDNLFVVDGSFMPSSAGVNPSLTIVANAIRVAENILIRE